MGVMPHTGSIDGASPGLSQAVENIEFMFAATDNITALAGGAQPGTLLKTGMNRVVTVASANDSVSLPASSAGTIVTVTNAHASNALRVYALGATDVINALSNATAFSVAATKTCDFICYTAGQWHTLLSA